MPRVRLDLDPLRETLLLTLYARALDSGRDRPILGDTRSAEVAAAIDYDFARLKVRPSLVCSTALRARRLDDVVRAFVAEHPDAVVLDLGCGLDTRVYRCDPPAGVDWYDVDFADVVALRPRFLPERSRRLGADVTVPGWLAGLPRDRPALVVAEGLVPFLPGDAFPRLVRELTGHFATGVLALNGYTRFAAWAMKYHPTIRAIGITAAQGFDDPHEPETWRAGLTLAGEDLLVRAPEVAGFPQPLRAATRLMGHSTGIARQGARILRYSF
ncbi:class I SAM-dependent methyltransferase [Actinocatenispora rupis]|uniref:Putative O-methyltransferase Omt n=1 Tax=Actinocatenispora rupis TaxID=519421 RepID=A0A8J3N930_9ACTN|nr:class I SAM-dependent methyltransferase [Actinocatenispora rupis]GID10924.1 putative O-methyltransferase Omt [Actinocatenispora rupis]